MSSLQIKCWSWLNILIQIINYTPVSYDIIMRYYSLDIGPTIHYMWAFYKLVYIIQQGECYQPLKVTTKDGTN